MGSLRNTFIRIHIVYLCLHSCYGAKINTPRVLLPWFENLHVNFTFEIIEGGCYSWSLSRDDIIDLQPLYEDTWSHCSRAARVSVSKSCAPPGSVIILAEEENTGEILRGDVDIDKIGSLKVMSTTWKLYLEEAPEAFEVVAYDDQGNKFSTLEGVSFTWTLENIGTNYGEDPLVTLVRWRDTDYEAPRGVTELEAKGLRSNTVLLYGQAMGESRLTVCLENICTDVRLQVVASVVLTPAIAYIAPGDTLRYRVVRARAGRLTIQDVADTLYNMRVPDTGIAFLEDTISLVRGRTIGSETVYLLSGVTDIASATLTIVEPHSIRVSIRPAQLLVHGEPFTIHCVVFDEDGHPLTAGQEMLIRLTVDGFANVDLLRSTENGTITDAIANNAGEFTVTARLYSIAGRILMRKVEGQASAVVVDPLEIVPPELFIGWTDNIQDVPLRHRGGGEELVTWSESESETHDSLSLAPTGLLTVRGVGQLGVRVHLTQYPHINAKGRVWSAVPEMIQVSSSGHARVGRPHHLHIALTATHPVTGELYNFHRCDCATFTVSLIEGPEPQNVTAAPWVPPVEGACCVVECRWLSRGVSTLRVSRGRSGQTARVAVRASPALLWPRAAAALPHATLPVLAEGEALVSQSLEPRVAELVARDGPPPHRYPDVQLFTLKCRRKGEAIGEITSVLEEERESVRLETACAPHVSRIRLDPADTPANCSAGPRLWLRPGHEVTLKVTLLDAIGRELLDERGPPVAWHTQPEHVGIQYRATDRLFVEMDPEYAPVPVPMEYYQLVIADEQAIGWSGTLKASIPEATATIQAKVVAPLVCDPMKVNLAWEGETVTVGSVTGGSGRYIVEGAKGVEASVEGSVLNATLPAPGTYDLVVSDMCVNGETQTVEVNIEEVLSVEVSTARAVGVGACVPISALVKGVSHRYLSTSRSPDWRTIGHITVKDGSLCGIKEGTGRVRAALGGVWSPEVEVYVFPALSIVPARARLPPAARLQLTHVGGPPRHLATLAYYAPRAPHVEVSPSGSVLGVSIGTSRVRLVATDIANVELASAEAEIEVVAITGLRVVAATQTLLVGHPAPVWLQAAGLAPGALAALQPPPRVTWTLRDAAAARLYTTHADDYLERSVAEGLSVRVVPLKPGVITLDVRVRNMGQAAEIRSWDSTIEILGISDIRTSVDGLSQDLASGDRLSLAVGASVRLKSVPRGVWTAYEDGAFELKPTGEVKAIRPGHGVIVARHKDERNNIDRETAIHVEVSSAHYCTAEGGSGESGDGDGTRVVLRNSHGRPLLAPLANVSVAAPHVARQARHRDSVLGNELHFIGLDTAGAFMSFQATVGDNTLTDEVWVTGSDGQANKVLGSWAICLEGVGWRAPAGVEVAAGAGVSLAVLARDRPARHTLRLDRPPLSLTVHQLPLDKMEFQAGEWPASLVPLTIDAAGLASGPLLCTEEQKYALEGVQVELPFVCRTKAPHTAQPILDIANGQLGCSIIPAAPITQASEVELCAEWGAYRTCTRVQLLPLIELSHTKVSFLNPPPTFTISGHPHALQTTKITSTPGLKFETNTKNGQITVTVRSETPVCGSGWVNVVSRLTSQDLKVEVERECDISSGTLLGALFSLVSPYIPTLISIAAVVAAYMYVQSRLQQKGQLRLPAEPPHTLVPDTPRTRTWSRSPYASRGPSVPVYGDASVLPDSSFSPNSTSMHSRFL